MRIEILSLGKGRQKYLQVGEAEYMKRLSTFAKVSITEIPLKEGTTEQAKARESDAVLAKIPDKGFLVVLDEAGQEFNSIGFATYLEKKINSGNSSIYFAVGAYHGWSKKVMERADLVLSLSKFTFTYEHSRLILLEQIYRAYSIMRGLPYHRGEDSAKKPSR